MDNIIKVGVEDLLREYRADNDMSFAIDDKAQTILICSTRKVTVYESPPLSELKIQGMVDLANSLTAIDRTRRKV